LIDTGTALIVTSLIGLAGIFLFNLINNSNWFKRENFKIQKSNIMAENRIKLRKMERELGLPNKTTIKETPTGNILDTLKNLDIDKIQGILDLLGNKEELEEDETPTDKLIKMVTENPQIINKVLGSLGDNKKDDYI